MKKNKHELWGALTGLCLSAASVFTLITLQANEAKAQEPLGFYVEPGVTYQLGNNKIQWPAPFSESTGTNNGPGVSVKAGLHFLEVGFGGLDVNYSLVRFKNSSTNYEADATSSLVGVTGGAQMPLVGLRVWGGFIFTGTLDPAESRNIDVRFDDARGYKLGAGFKVLLVSVNLEYVDVQYQTSRVEKFGPITGSFDSKLNNKALMLGVSFPLTL